MGPFLESSEFMNPIGCNSEQLSNIFKYCGYESVKLSDGKRLYYFKQNKPNIKKEKIIKKKKSINLNKVKRNIRTDPNSPFAVLEKLL